MRGPYLYLARAIRGGVKVWLTDNIDAYEDGALLEKPRIAAALVSLPSDKSFASFEAARAMWWGRGRPMISISPRASNSSTGCANTRSGPIAWSSPSTCGSTGWAAPSLRRCASYRPT